MRPTAEPPRFLPVGRDGLLIEVGSVDEARALYAEVRAMIARQPDVAPVDVVPGACTVLLSGADPDRWRAALSDWTPGPAPSSTGRTVTIPTHYDGADLAEVAGSWGCSVDEVIERHLSTDFVVAFCGFAPGFAYCAGVPELPEVPRRSEPRTRVPAGSVGLAGRFCGIYPREMPGGWQLLGRTELVLFDPARERPALLAPGDTVRFEVAR